MVSLVPVCQGFLPLPGLVGGGMVEFLGDRLGGLATESRGDTGVSMPALTGDWSDLTERNSLAPPLGGWMTDMSPTKGRLRELVLSTSIGSSCQANMSEIVDRLSTQTYYLNCKRRVQVLCRLWCLDVAVLIQSQGHRLVEAV